MDKFQIETAQNVNIIQNVADVGDRILAYLIDGLIIATYVIIVSVLYSQLSISDDNYMIAAITIGLPIFLYHLLWEMFWDGRSPGKAVMKLRVVKLDGTKPAFSNFMVRWLLRIIDVTASSGAIALFSILLNGKGQRLGDIAATTTVITEKKTISLSQTILTDIPDDYIPKYPQVTVFKDSEIQTIKNLYNQSRYNGNHNVILRLSEKVAKMMEVNFDEKPVVFIDKVIKDYNYYTRNM
ncbi:RDD family protein [Ulvibacter antarcticus]|uniref:Putative RDD family membrane protein YckC n=1 Tax=Ulvibacter antarcticus TaxID=442714 RepID=A0A3L9Z358_9FLAO|nr:RDD family protein [Ulvibacter antarcticus]RMA64735.1 putative RDD family membrane protein YckC [Ulvibacter antarcticus]